MIRNKRIAFFCSGSGGGFHFIRVCIEKGLLPGAELAGAVVDRNSTVDLYCDAHGLPYANATFSRGSQWRELAPILLDLRPDVIVTNVHRIIDDEVLDRSPGKLVNLHYSLLPAFGGVIGMKAIEQAIEYGAKIIGCTAHRVTAQLDAGAPIAQVTLPLGHHEMMSDELKNAVFRAAALCLFATMLDSECAAMPIRIEGRPGLYSGPKYQVQDIVGNNGIWREVHEAANFGVRAATRP